METVRIDLEDKNTYLQPIQRLENMAALMVTLEALNYYYSYYEYFKNAYEVVDNLTVPKCIREKIRTLCVEMKREIRCFRRSRSSREADIMNLCNGFENEYNFFFYIAVWDTNGHIDDKKTIEKVLSSCRQSNYDDLVFKIITKYCLENYITDFPLSALSQEFIKTVEKERYNQHKLTDYWLELKRYGTSDFFYRATRARLLRSLKELDRNKYEWSAYEYFWNFLNENDQVTITKDFIGNNDYKKYQMGLFSKLNSHQLERLYSEEPVTIIINFLFLGEVDLAKATWERVKLTIESEKFEVLLKQVLKNGKPSKESCMQFSIYLWNRAPENLIEHMINVKNCQIITKFLNGKSTFDDYSNLEFVKTVLSRTTTEFKQVFLNRTGPYLILNKPDVFASLIEYCLIKETARSEVKENLLVEAMMSHPPAGIMHRFRNLFYSSREQFNEFLAFFTSKSSLQTRFKECLLKSGLLISKALWKDDTLAKLLQFVDELYPNPEVARQQKSDIMFSFLQSYCSYLDCYRSKGDEKFSEIDNYLSRVLTPEEVIIAKENIINRFLEKCESGSVKSLKRMNIQRFASWGYSGDEGKMERFRRSLPIDVLFRALLREIVERYVNGRDVELSFSSLDELLCWKFSDRRKIRAFKSDKIHSIIRGRVEERYLRKELKYSFVLKMVIEWIFCGDMSQIRGFERRYQKTQMMKIIHWMNLEEESTDCGEYYYHTSDESDGGGRQDRTNDQSYGDWDHYLIDNESDEFDNGDDRYDMSDESD